METESGSGRVPANGNSVGVQLGNGGGTFQPLVSYPVTSGAAYVTAYDFAGDGKTDLPARGNDGVNLLYVNGNGTFQAPVNYPEPQNQGTGPTGAMTGAFTANVSVDAVDEAGLVNPWLGSGARGSATRCFDVALRGCSSRGERRNLFDLCFECRTGSDERNGHRERTLQYAFVRNESRERFREYFAHRQRERCDRDLAGGQLSVREERRAKQHLRLC